MVNSITLKKMGLEFLFPIWYLSTVHLRKIGDGFLQVRFCDMKIELNLELAQLAECLYYPEVPRSY